MFWGHAHPCLTDRCLWKTFRPSTLGGMPAMQVYGRRVGDMGTSLVLGLCPYMLLSHQPARKLIRQRLFPLRHSSGRCPGESWLAPPQGARRCLPSPGSGYLLIMSARTADLGVEAASAVLSLRLTLGQREPLN